MKNTVYRTEDRKHGVQILGFSDGIFAAYAVQYDSHNDRFEYWYTIGNYKSEKNALKYAKKSLAKYGYSIAA